MIKFDGWDKIQKGIPRMSMQVQKHSPEIATTVGILGMLVGMVMACRSSMKLEGLKFKLDTEKMELQALKDDAKTEEDKRDAIMLLTKFYGRRILEYGKLYLPSALVTSLSIGSIVYGHSILSKRNAALAAAYAVVDRAYKRYREEAIREDEKSFIEESAPKKKKGQEIERTKKFMPSDYARWFDSNSIYWQKENGYNVFFLKSQQNYLNDLLASQGHVFLNEAYDALGIPRSQAGSIVGWIFDGDGNGFIDFGLFDEHNEVKREFMNGFSDSILLDFNVDGVIWDLI